MIIQRIVQILMFLGVLMAAKAAWPKNDVIINWYTSESRKDYNVLEVCLKDECHKLLHKSKSINEELIKKWVDEVILIDTKIKEYKNEKQNL